MEEEWLLWRLVIAEPPVATLTELETVWSLDDVLRGNAALDFRLYAQRVASEKKGG